MMRRLNVIVCLGFALSLGCTKNGSGNSTAKDSTVIKIGEYGSMTGAEATFGQSTHKGILLALDAKNAAGGINGKKIVLVSEDDQGKPEEAAAVAKKLITQDQVIALIGEVASTRSLAAAPIAQQYKVPMISPSSTNPKVTQIGDYIFRVCFIDAFQGSVIARFTGENLKLKKIAIFKDYKSDYSLGLAEFFSKKLKELGGEVVAEETFQAGDSDFKGQLTRIRSKNPEAIFIPAYYTDVGLIARQARQLGIKATLIGGDGWDSPKLFEIGQDSIEGSYFSNHYAIENPVPATQNFITKYKEKYNEAPDGMAATGYDAAMILINAIEKAKELTPTAVRDQLASTKDFDGATGKITINGERNADKAAFFMKVEGKALKFVTQVGPQ